MRHEVVRFVEELKSGISLTVGLLVAAVLIVPAVIVQLAMLPFAKPDTPDDVANVLRKCIDGADDAEDEFDDFTSWKIADPSLDQIRTEMLALTSTDWETEETRNRFRELLRHVETMTKAPSL